MSLDIRIPIGGPFALLGLLLSIYGLFSDAFQYQRSLGINVNLWWGLVLLLSERSCWRWPGCVGLKTKFEHPGERS